MQNDCLSQNGYKLDKDQKTITKVVDGVCYKRSIKNTRDIVKYRVFSLRCILSIIQNRGFNIYHYVPVDMHNYSVRFRSMLKQKEMLFYKLYFYNLLLEVQKKYKQFDCIIDKIKNSYSYKAIYHEYDEIFRKTVGIHPIWFGLIVSLEIYIHNRTDRLISLDLIRSAMNDNINASFLPTTSTTSQQCDDNLVESLEYMPKSITEDIMSCSDNLSCKETNRTDTTDCCDIPAATATTATATTDTADNEPLGEMDIECIDRNRLCDMSVQKLHEIVLNTTPSGIKPEITPLNLCSALPDSVPQPVSQVVPQVSQDKDCVDSYKEKFEEQCTINKHLHEYINTLLGEIASLKSKVDQYQSQVQQSEQQPMQQQLQQQQYQVQYTQDGQMYLIPVQEVYQGTCPTTQLYAQQ